MSENISVKSVVGRYLEHSRVYRFNYVELTEAVEKLKEEIFISSADMMERNLDNRVEVAIPILDKGVRKQLNKDLDNYLKDNVNSYVLNSKGEYTEPIYRRYADDSNDLAYDIQNKFINKYEKIEKRILYGL
jgi:polyphosphate kinase